MNWQDKGYLISSNRYNENSSIIELFTQDRGKVKGILFGATSKKIKNYLFVGNCFHINFSSKNENSIGNFKLEIDKVNTPIFLGDQIKLSCIVNIFNLIKLLTVENQKNVIAYFDFGVHKIPAIISNNKNVIGVQFHPEISGQSGVNMFSDLVTNI